MQVSTRLHEGALTSEGIPFNTPIYLSTEQIIQLSIDNVGRSQLPEFAKSRFKVERNSPDWIYKITRVAFEAKVIHLPYINKEGSCPFLSFSSEFDEVYRENSARIPMYVLHAIPDEILGSGVIGQVYSIISKEKLPMVFKILRSQMNVKEGRPFSPIRLKPENVLLNQDGDSWEMNYVTPLSDTKMSLSFFRAFSEAHRHSDLIASKHYPKCYGMLYIREMHVWSVLTQYIPGQHISSFINSLSKAKKIMMSVLQGLKELDRQGSPYTDIKTENFLVLEDDTAVLIDDVANGCKNPERSKRSRKLFGTLLFQAISKDALGLHTQVIPSKEWIGANKEALSSQLGSELAKLLMDCWSEASMEEVSWDKVESQLSTL